MQLQIRQGFKSMMTPFTIHNVDFIAEYGTYGNNCHSSKELS